jgi:iron(III) transport system permease protein
MQLSPGGYITYFLKSFGLNVPDIYTLEAMIVFISLYLTSHIFLFLSSAFKSMDLTLEESSRISGANIIRTAFKITIPLMRPALIFSSILTFILAIEQFSVPFILGLKKGIYTLTTYLYTLEVGIGEVAMEMRFSRMAVGAVITILIAIFLTSLQRKLIKDPYRFVTITARGYQPKVIKLGSLKYLAFIICFGFFFISVIIPIFTLVYRSFLTSWAPYANQLELFTLNNYINLFYIPTALIALRNSIFISITGALIAAFLTSIASYIIFRSEFFGRKQLDYVCTLPASIPGVIMGIGFLMAWLRFPIGIYGTIWCLVIVYITRFLTSGVRSSSSSLLQISKEHEDSAKILGASWIQIFLKILLPLMKQGIIAGWLLMFISMMNELSASIFLAPPGSPVLMVYMIDLWEYGNTGIMSALAIIQILLSFIIIIFFRRLWGIKLYA